MKFVKLLPVLLLSLQLFGCTSTQEPQTVEIKQQPISPKTVTVVKPAQPPTQSQHYQSPQANQQTSIQEQEKDIVKEAQERYQKQRELDQKANQEWWNSVLKQQKEILEMQQQHELEMKKLTN